MNDHVSLRDFIERIVAEHEKRRDDLRAEDRRWLERELDALAKALALQAKENERRLDILNHAHEQAREVLGTYLPRELYERGRAETHEWQRKADLQAVAFETRLKSVELGIVNLPGGVKRVELGLATQAGQNIGTQATNAITLTIGAVLVAVVSVVIAIVTYITK